MNELIKQFTLFDLVKKRLEKFDSSKKKYKI